LEGLGKGDGAGFIHQLAHGAEGVGEEVCGAGAVLLSDTHIAVEVGVGAVGEDLGQAGGEVQGVMGGDAVNGLGEAVAYSILFSPEYPVTSQSRK
jgi:hypothetical protein